MSEARSQLAATTPTELAVDLRDDYGSVVLADVERMPSSRAATYAELVAADVISVTDADRSIVSRLTATTEFGDELAAMGSDDADLAEG